MDSNEGISDDLPPLFGSARLFDESMPDLLVSSVLIDLVERIYSVF